MTTISLRSEAFARGARMLRTAFGPAISAYLEDPSIVEVMLDLDGGLWIERVSGGLEDTGGRITPANAERIVRLVAHHVEVHANSPRVSTELPESGERVEGLMPPVVAAPCFATSTLAAILRDAISRPPSTINATSPKPIRIPSPSPGRSILMPSSRPFGAGNRR